MPLTRKALALFTLAAVFPALGLSWSMRSLDDWQDILQRPQAFQRLEARLESIENEYRLKLGEILAGIRRFTGDPILALDPPPPDLLDGLVRTINRKCFIGEDIQLQFNAAHRLQGPYYFSPSRMNPIGSPAKSATLDFVRSMMAIMVDAFHFSVDDPRSVNDSFRGGIVMEYLQVLLGKNRLYGMLKNQDSLQQIKVFDETIWYYLSVLYDIRMEPRLIGLFNLPRKKTELQFCHLTIQQQAAGPADFRSPPLLLLSTLDSGSLQTFPDRGTRFPELIEPQCTIIRDGGSRKLLLKVDGREYHAVARPIAGMDFVGMALEPVTDRAGEGVPRLLTVWLPLLYPVVILILALLLFRSIFLRPVEELQRGVSAIADGSLEIRLPVLTGDELGRLCISFNRMADGLREKEFLSRFLSDLTLERVRSGAEARATRTHAAVMFSDIRGFTTLSEERPPEEVVTMLNEYLTLMESVIETHGGSIDKFIGDAIMAVFLPALGREIPGLRAVQAGLDMRRALADFNREREGRGAFTIRTGIGIASGEVLMGILGEGGRRDFTVTGPTVNLAATMEKRSKEARHSFVVVCPNTARQLDGRWTLLPLVKPDDTATAASAWEVVFPSDGLSEAPRGGKMNG